MYDHLKSVQRSGVIPDGKVEADKALTVAQKMALEKLLLVATKDDKERYQRALSDLSKDKG